MEKTCWVTTHVIKIAGGPPDRTTTTSTTTTTTTTITTTTITTTTITTITTISITATESLVQFRYTSLFIFS
ncbi:hypothetical protein E2C01_073679 [Portunus trituberculatus]|uniref:Uncharacterized protein n=1 Tax=Portunus trituberculatus TaxID=210409 RepID=A0A5B7IB86_PORTR|nr:hypothetical protein [Portunus trituberculatus]